MKIGTFLFDFGMQTLQNIYNLRLKLKFSSKYLHNTKKSLNFASELRNKQLKQVNYEKL